MHFLNDFLCEQRCKFNQEIYFYSIWPPFASISFSSLGQDVVIPHHVSFSGEYHPMPFVRISLSG